MGTRRSEIRTEAVLKYLVLSGVPTTAYNCIVLLISVVSGEWLFGESVCQLHAYLSNTFISASVWILSIACVERYYKMTSPSEHLYLFSKINTVLMVMGVTLLVCIIHTGPMYGWGEFVTNQGKIEVSLEITRTQHNDGSCLNFFPFLPSKSTECHYRLYSAINNATESLLNNRFKMVHRTFLLADQTKTLFIIRGPSQNKAQELERHIQSFSRDVLALLDFNMKQANGDVFLKNFTRPLKAVTSNHFVCLTFRMNKEAFQEYISIQDLGLCTVDYLDFRGQTKSWMLFNFITGHIFPYLVVIASACACVLRVRLQSIESERESYEIACTVLIFVGGFLGMFMSCPYYIIYLMFANTRSKVLTSYCFTSHLLRDLSSIVPSLPTYLAWKWYTRKGKKKMVTDNFEKEPTI